MLEVRKNRLTHVPGIVAYANAHTYICTHSFMDHNPWHTVCYFFIVDFKVAAMFIYKSLFIFFLKTYFFNNPYKTKQMNLYVLYYIF